MIKFFAVILILGLSAVFSVCAQVSVDVTLDQQQFLQCESLPIAVHITNLSGQPLHLGVDPNWLTFSIEADDGFIVVKNADVPVVGAFDLGSSEVATKRVDLEPYFVLNHPGRYHVTAIVRVKNWDTEFASAPQKFDIISGAELWSQTFGVPSPQDKPTNAPPEVRKYVLEEANYLRSQLRLYVQVSDESGSRVFKVAQIGRAVSFSSPETQLDRHSNLHVLWQSGASAFSYVVLSPDGNIVQQETYDYLTTRPRLGINDAGEITVIGGVRRVQPDEIPIVKSPDELPAKP